MTRSSLVLFLAAALVGGGLLITATPVQASSWSVSVGGHGSGYFYNLGYRDYGRHHRSHRHFVPVTGHRYRPVRHYYGPVYRAPRHQVHVGYYWRPYTDYYPAHVGYYSAPVVVREPYYAPRYAPARQERGVRYYDYRPTPRAGYDRVGYGDQYVGPDTGDRYEYDELDEEAFYEDSESHEAYPEDAPGRIERR
ncbi:MAG TPA: hypothetical protein PKZ76_12930 [Xanthomonadaceae bacterium]|nr:hypothetical protein [Xanthomonadaceae bacterium]